MTNDQIKEEMKKDIAWLFEYEAAQKRATRERLNARLRLQGQKEVR